MTVIDLGNVDEIYQIIKGCTNSMPISFLEKIFEEIKKDCFLRLRKGEDRDIRNTLINGYWRYIKLTESDYLYEEFVTEALFYKHTPKDTAKKILLHTSKEKMELFNTLIIRNVGADNFALERDFALIKHYEYGWKRIKKGLDLNRGLNADELVNLVQELQNLFRIRCE